MASYQVPPDTVSAALGRLTGAGLSMVTLTRECSRWIWAVSVPGGPWASRRLPRSAAALRRTPVVVTGQHFDPAALHQASEIYLSAGRRAIRNGLTNDDARLVTAARDLLDDAAGKTAPPPPMEPVPRSWRHAPRKGSSASTGRRSPRTALPDGGGQDRTLPSPAGPPVATAVARQVGITPELKAER